MRDCFINESDIKAVKECSTKIELVTLLNCYNTTDYDSDSLIKKGSKLTWGDTIYCELKFRDPSIERFLHLE